MARATERDHTDAIDWPNGEGYTPRTPEYRALMDERDAIYDANWDRGSLNDLSPEDYEHWHQIDAKLYELQNDGHLGIGVRF